jgi:hypothetical protein
MDFEKVFYRLSYEDMQNVAMDVLDRNLTENECRLLEDKIAEMIDWYGIIETAIIEYISKNNK